MAESGEVREMAEFAAYRVREVEERVEQLEWVGETVDVIHWCLNEILDALQDHDIAISDELDDKLARLAELASILR